MLAAPAHAILSRANGQSSAANTGNSRQHSMMIRILNHAVGPVESCLVSILGRDALEKDDTLQDALK